MKFLMLKQAAREGRLFLDDITVETTDRETVKKNVISIEEYIQNIINAVKKCDIIVSLQIK